MKVSVAVRQKFHGFQLAQQFYDHGLLKKLFTSHYGRILGRDNSIGFSIDRKKIVTNFYSALVTYGFRNHGFNNDDRFGRWVAGKLVEENIIVTWGIQALPIMLRAKELGIKVVLERGSTHASVQRDLLLEEYRSLKLSTKKIEESFSSRRMERELLEYELADVVSIPSSFVKKGFLSKGFDEKKLFVNAYGADLSNFRFDPRPHLPFRIIYAGALSIRKGVHYLLEAFSMLHLGNAELWLVGKIEPAMQTFFARYASENIKIFEPVPQQSLADLYNQCDLFVICSIEEGMAMVQPQAMACGLPLICTTNTGGDDLVTDGEEGYVIPARDVKILCESIKRLYEDKILSREMGQKAMARIARGLTWSDYGNRAVAHYKILLGE